jgi:multisubunit Na+/H+ antiporter MnhB subunit
MAALLPIKYMAAVTFGSGICGLVMNAIRAVTLTIFLAGTSESPQEAEFWAAFTFIGVSVVVLTFAFFWHVIFIRKNSFYIYYLDWHVAEKQGGVQVSQDELALLNAGH